MAIIKMKPPKCGKMINLKYLLDYIMNEEKTAETLIYSQNCNADSAYEEMVLTKEFWNKTDGRQYCHIIQSFDPKQNITPEIAHEIGQRLLEEFSQFEGFEIVMATHRDKRHIHNHFAINSVNGRTGLKWEQRREDLIRLKEYSNRLCEEYGLTQIKFDDNRKNQSYGEWRNRKANSSWKRQLEKTICICLNVSESREQFFHAMNYYGYSVTWTNERKYITFTTPDGKKCRNSKLSNQEYFSKENMQRILDRNYQNGFVSKEKYNWCLAENLNSFVYTLSGFGKDCELPEYIEYPQLDGLTQTEQEIAIAEYLWYMEWLKKQAEYENQRDELSDFIDNVAEIFELMCEYNFVNCEEKVNEKYDYTDREDDEEWEL